MTGDSATVFILGIVFPHKTYQKIASVNSFKLRTEPGLYKETLDQLTRELESAIEPYSTAPKENLSWQ